MGLLSEGKDSKTDIVSNLTSNKQLIVTHNPTPKSSPNRNILNLSGNSKITDSSKIITNTPTINNNMPNNIPNNISNIPIKSNPIKYNTKTNETLKTQVTTKEVKKDNTEANS